MLPVQSTFEGVTDVSEVDEIADQEAPLSVERMTRFVDAPTATQ